MIPKKIKKALDIISGYCEKHISCEKCPMKVWCENERDKVPGDWLKQEVGE